MDEERNISRSFYRCLNSDYCLALLKPDEKFSLFGIFSFRVLCGEIFVRGRNVKPAEKLVISVNAPYCLGPPLNIYAGPEVIQTPSPVTIRRVEKLAERPKLLIRDLKNSGSLLLFWTKENNVALLISGLYSSIFFVPSNVNAEDGYKLTNYCCVMNKDFFPPIFSIAFAKAVFTLKDRIESRKNEGKMSTVVITGPKNVGKSMLARCLISLLFEKDGPPVYLLDCDVGQAECTPPGCVSLHKIDSLLFDASFTSQKSTFSQSYFFGNISPSNDPHLYMSLISDLLDCYSNESDVASTLLINTCGWVEGMGSDLLNFIICQSSPHFIFNIESTEVANYDAVGIVKKLSGKAITVFSSKAEAKIIAGRNLPPSLPPSALRELLITGYFSKFLLLNSVSAFGDVPPLAVSFKSVYLYINPLLGLVPETHIFAALNCTLVALCTTTDSDLKNYHRVLSADGMPFIINDESVKLRCWGFGFIRAIDLEKRLFYVITPVDREVLKNVNVLARGNDIDLPSYFLTQQHSRDAPYVVSVERRSLQSDMYMKLRLTRRFRSMNRKRPLPV